MKIRKVTWRPRAYMERRFAERPAGEPCDYESLRRFIFADFMGTSDAWGDGLRRLGYDAVDIPLRIRSLEEAWWREHGGIGPPPDSDTVTAEILRREAPDVLIVEGLENYSVRDIDKFRAWLPRLRLLVGTTGNEINDSSMYSRLDLFLSIRPVLVARAKAAGIAAHRISQGFDDRILAFLANVERTKDFVFAGSILSGEKYHERRRRILERIATSGSAEIYTDSNLSLRRALPEYLVKLGAFGAARVLDRFGVPLERLPAGRQFQSARSWSRPPELNWSPALARAARPSVYGVEMYRTLASARVTINVQPGNADNLATNMRLFEATGAGACLVTDTADDMSDFFAEDEIVTFETAEEAIEKVTYLVRNSAAAADIARRGARRTLKDHTYAVRMEYVARLLGQAIATAR